MRGGFESSLYFFPHSPSPLNKNSAVGEIPFVSIATNMTDADHDS